ncbi:hypothetical protein CesoFtcFv8_003658 [Champsocephalus esox]|uniref:Uncharacterized protein n=1 Tax=Champsocephalus esox TaxID=159716 RepID=A0AAN8HC42_9TELE|nr:hypothetical protein CesoFtcFv8_003658 [Champsocephalus esox]
MAKWKRGLKVREQEKVVWWGSYKHKNGTGQVHNMNKSSLAKRELMKREALPCRHRTWIDDRHYPANNPVKDLVQGVN